MPAVALTAAVALVAAATPASAKTSKRLPRPWAAKHHVGTRAPGRAIPTATGCSNWGEYRAQTNPHRRDSDRDHVLDALEDRDGDHLANADEVAAGTDPCRRDSDRDRIPDGREDRDRDGLPNAAETPTGHVLLRPDSDGYGILDGRENAGTIRKAMPARHAAVAPTSGPVTAARRERTHEHAADAQHEHAGEAGRAQLRYGLGSTVPQPAPLHAINLGNSCHRQWGGNHRARTSAPPATAARGYVR